MRGPKSAIAAVALLAALQPLSAEATSCRGGYYPTVEIGGDVTTSKTYTLAELQAKAASKLNVAFFSGRSGMPRDSAPSKTARAASNRLKLRARLWT